MSQPLVEQTEYTQQLDKVTCEAYGCEELATETISVSAGEFGTIELNICKNCVSKFKRGATGYEH